MDVKNQITRTVGKVKLGAIKHSPEILLAAGIISGGAALVFAIKSTLKAERIIDEHIDKMEAIKEVAESEDKTITDDETGEVIVMDDKMIARAKTVRYVRTGWAFVKLYAPTIIFSTLAVTCILTSHGILRKRNVALAATLATVRTAFDEYRGRVVRDLGAEMDKHFLYDTVDREFDIETTDDKGKKKSSKEKYSMPTASNAYSRFFDESNPNWEKDGSANYIFVRSQMLHLQNKLIKQGYLFLNEAYDALDIPRTAAGQSAGWIYDFNNKENTIISFDGFDVHEVDNSPVVRALMNGYERNVLINFENLRDDILTDLPRIDSSFDAI